MAKAQKRPRRKPKAQALKPHAQAQRAQKPHDADKRAAEGRKSTEAPPAFALPAEMPLATEHVFGSEKRLSLADIAPTDGDTPRDLVAATAIDQRLAALVRPLIEAMGYELVRVRLQGGKRKRLQIMADRPDGGIEIEEITEITHAVSALLDVEDPIAESYTLEVSSPGIDRPLTRWKDFAAWAGFEVKIETNQLIDGRRRFTGRLLGTKDNEVLIALAQGKGERVVLGLKFAWLAEAKLMLTDDLIAESLRQRQARGAALDFDPSRFDVIETETDDSADQ